MKKVLVVDDEENVRELYREVFEELGLHVITASGGKEALRFIEEQHRIEPFSLVTLDMRMQEMDGIETLRKIKKKSCTLPVVILTAYEEYKHDFGQWHSDGYLVKSSDIRAVRDFVKKILKV